jgi:hypothetical protein
VRLHLHVIERIHKNEKVEVAAILNFGIFLLTRLVTLVRTNEISFASRTYTKGPQKEKYLHMYRVDRFCEGSSTILFPRIKFPRRH